MRPPELDDATALARRLGDPVLADILAGIELPAGHDQRAERYARRRVEEQAREQLEEARARAQRALTGQLGDAAKAVAQRWAGEYGVTLESLGKAGSAALGRLEALLNKLPRVVKR